jgi:hypothetical protein
MDTQQTEPDTDTQAGEQQPPVPRRGMTTRELSRSLRVGRDRIRRWIASGQLQAVNLADYPSARPKYVVLPEYLAAFLKRRSASPPPKAPRRKRRPADYIDFFPGD